MLKHKLYREDGIIVRMDKKTEDKPQARKTNRLVIIAGAVVLVIVLLVLMIPQLTAPKRSVAAYCQTYKEEKARLTKLPGNTWPSGVFNDAIGDAGEFATSFGKLESVAPEEIRGDVTALKAVYQKIDADPSQAISASLSGSSADGSLKSWTNQNCKVE
jgi:hypothetical protein